MNTLFANKSGRNGFGLILVMIGISMVAFAMILLTSISQTIVFQARQARLESDSNNLQASALAWAQCNRSRLEQSPGQPVSLDCASLKIPGAQATVAAVGPVGNVHTVRISTFCGQAKYVLRKNCVYLLSSQHL
jgi:hypothetical protein